MARPPTRTVWRIALLWQGTVLDVVTLKRTRGTIELRTGDVLKLRAVAGALEVTGLGDPFLVEPDALTDLPAGHALIASRVAPEAQVGTLSALDSTLFHAAMIGAAVQVCVVSALVLAPAATFDTEPGAGMPGQWRRLLVAPGGTAPNVGQAQLNIVGRAPDEVERLQPVRAKGQRPASRAGKGMTLEQALLEMNRVLHLGNDGTELKQAIGEVAQAQARAPVAGADFGGLSPKDPTETGQGNGLIGAGESRLTEALRTRIVENDKNATKALKREPRPAIPVQLMELPATEVRLSPDEALDPVVKDTLASAVRRRDNAVRACYEDRALRQDKSQAGRLTLELTLLPEGHVVDAKVHVENAKLRGVADCVEKVAGEWYLGDGLVDQPTRMSFPFILTPHNDVEVYDFSNEAAR